MEPKTPKQRQDILKTMVRRAHMYGEDVREKDFPGGLHFEVRLGPDGRYRGLAWEETPGTKRTKVLTTWKSRQYYPE